MDSLELRVDEETVESFLSGDIPDLPKGADHYVTCGAKLESSARDLAKQFGEGQYSNYVSRVAFCFAELSQSAFDFEHAGERTIEKHLSEHYERLQELVKLYAEGVELAKRLGEEKRDEFLSFVYRIADKIELVNNIRDPEYQMHDFLIGQLEACTKEERGAVALALARTRTDRAVDALIDKVEGKVYGKVLGFVPYTGKQYDAKDRLKVLHALGESGNEKALDYLQNALTVRKVGWHHEEFFGYKSFANVNYPNARGALRGDLRGLVWRLRTNLHKFDAFFPEDAKDAVNPPDGKERIGRHAALVDKSKACYAAERAVKKLRETLGISRG
jgi:hypothetical protein